MEAIGQNIPALVFIFAGTFNFYQIRSIGFNRIVNYSLMFKLKLYSSSTMIILSCVQIIVLLTKAFMSEVPPDQRHLDHQYSESLRNCIDEMLGTQSGPESTIATYFILLIMLVQTLAWLGSVRLLVYEYRKGLSEVWYSHKMFWVSNFAVWGI